jgi:hypothetical protein
MYSKVDKKDPPIKVISIHKITTRVLTQAEKDDREKCCFFIVSILSITLVCFLIPLIVKLFRLEIYYQLCN